MAQVAKDKAQRWKLSLSKLDFVSLVDDPAQPNATTLLIKRKGKGEALDGHAKFVKASEQLGLAFFWAFTSTEKSGEPHYDHHGDAVQADDDMVRAAMEFMQDGGAVDEMHDYDATKARVVFAMPMTPEIAKAYGIETKQTGLMVAIKVTDEQLEKLKDGTYTGVSIAGLGTREIVEARKGRVVKGCLVTDEQAGHQHTIEVLDDGSLWCSYNTATGAEYTHNHAVIRSSEGAIEILADSGHSHSLAADQPAVVIVAPSDIVIVAEVVAARRSPTTKFAERPQATSDSPRSQPTPTVKTLQEQSKMTTEANDAKTIDLEKQVVSLTKRAERGERIAKLSGAEKAHFDTLSGDDAEAFLAKSNADRAAAMAADPIEFALDGVEYRKSTQGYTLAKRLRDEVEKNNKVEIEKQVSQTIPHLAGETDAKCALIKAVRNSGENAEMQTKMLGILKGGDAFAKGRTVAQGGDGGIPVDKTASEQLDELTIKYATEKSVDRPTARVAVMKTAEGRKLYAESIGR